MNKGLWNWFELLSFWRYLKVKPFPMINITCILCYVTSQKPCGLFVLILITHIRQLRLREWSRSHSPWSWSPHLYLGLSNSKARAHSIRSYELNNTMSPYFEKQWAVYHYLLSTMTSLIGRGAGRSENCHDFQEACCFFFFFGFTKTLISPFFRELSQDLTRGPRGAIASTEVGKYASFFQFPIGKRTRFPNSMLSPCPHLIDCVSLCY